MLQIKEYQASDGQTLRYGYLAHPEQPSTGRALLFIPGLGGSVKGALGFLECLLPFYSPVYAPDLRSFGLNEAIDADGNASPLHHARHLLPDLEAFHRRVIEPERRQGVFQELAMCGISLGAVLATLLAAEHPQYYSRLTLLAPAYRPHPKSFGPGYVIRNTLSFLFLGRKARTRLPYTVTALTRNPAVLEELQALDLPPLVLAPGFLLGVRDLCNQALREVRRLTLPTFMAIPGCDIVCDPQAMRRAYALIPASTPKRCIEYPNVYHDVLFEAEHPEIAAEMLRWAQLDQESSSLAASVSS